MEFGGSAWFEGIYSDDNSWNKFLNLTPSAVVTLSGHGPQDWVSHLKLTMVTCASPWDKLESFWVCGLSAALLAWWEPGLILAWFSLSSLKVIIIYWAGVELSGPRLSHWPPTARSPACLVCWTRTLAFDLIVKTLPGAGVDAFWWRKSPGGTQLPSSGQAHLFAVKLKPLECQTRVVVENAWLILTENWLERLVRGYTAGKYWSWEFWLQAKALTTASSWTLPF